LNPAEKPSLSEVLLSGDTAYAERYTAALEAERAIFRDLRPLAESLGPAVVDRLASAEAQASAWHARVAAREIVDRGGIGPGADEASARV
jgi:CHASE3 domain sensor protein